MMNYDNLLSNPFLSPTAISQELAENCVKKMANQPQTSESCKEQIDGLEAENEKQTKTSTKKIKSLKEKLNDQTQAKEKLEERLEEREEKLRTAKETIKTHKERLYKHFGHEGVFIDPQCETGLKSGSA